MRKIKAQKCFLLVCVTALFCVICTYLLTQQDRPVLIGRREAVYERKKVILAWTGFFYFENWMAPSLTDLKCEFSSCVVTYNRSVLEESDAVIMHWADVKLQDLPPKREGRKVILLNYESPLRSSTILDTLNDLIDWTATYRLDSDIFAYYGMLKPLVLAKHTVVHPENNIEFHKKRLAAWLVSDCRASSQRRKVVEELLTHGVTIDEYGTCSTGNASLRRISTDEAYKYLAGKYKFYLSFENSLCRDYATEKLYHPLYHGMVPVVFGGADYKRLLPENSFIDVLDFKSLEDLSNHLKTIEGDEHLYSKYHEWRKFYYVSEHSCSKRFFCELCEKLHNPKAVLERHNRNLVKWWDSKKDCFNLEFKNKIVDIESTRLKRDALYLNND